MDREQIFAKIRAAGRAALTFDIENSHSGNISIKWTAPDGTDHVVITATGSMKGDLTPDKICAPAIAATDFGHFKASTETDIHARVLQIPGVSACMHGHTKNATAVTMDDHPWPKPSPRPDFIPVDPLGVRYLGRVGVDWFKVASGSPEMTETLPRRLETAPVTMIQEHGAIARGACIEEAFFYLCITEYSGQAAFLAEMVHADLYEARRNFESLREQLMPRFPDFSARLDQRRDFSDEPETVEMFLTTGFRIFESRYSPFHTGSMSIRTARTILFAPKASMPHDLPGPLLELPLNDDAAPSQDIGARVPSPAHSSAHSSAHNDYDLCIHRYLYEHTPFKSLIHCFCPEIDVIVLVSGEPEPSGKTRIRPIDAEGGFLYPAVPILPEDADPAVLASALMDYRVVVVANGGIWSAGEQSLGEALRHVSSIKDICYYRIMGQIRGLTLENMEPPRSKSW